MKQWFSDNCPQLPNSEILLYKIVVILFPGPELRKLLKWPRPLPLEDERVRLLREVLYRCSYPVVYFFVSISLQLC